VTDNAFIAETPDGPITGWTNATGTGTPLLLLHGGPGFSEYMSMLDAEVEGWPTIRFQQRGMPPSTLTGPFTVEHNVADAIAVLDELKVGQAVVLGHSWGGHLALHLAVAAPDRVAGLVLVDPLGAVGDGGTAEMGQALVGRLAPSMAGRYAEVAGRLAGPAPTEDDSTESLRLLWPSYFSDQANAMPIPPELRLSRGVYATTFGSVAEHLAGGFGSKLGGVKAPAEFVLGEQSPMPVSQGQQTAALLPSAEAVVIPGAGHLPWHEQPGCVAAALARVATRAGLALRRGGVGGDGVHTGA
jgi:pimeloyl-ACP methyl ester carboxylesterase